MNVYLMYPGKDFDLKTAPDFLTDSLIYDLELDTIFNEMHWHNPFDKEILIKAVSQPLESADEIYYRQGCLQDCIGNPEVIAKLRTLAIDTVRDVRRTFDETAKTSPNKAVVGSVKLLRLFHDRFTKLKRLSDNEKSKFKSRAFIRFFAMISEQLSDDYLAQMVDYIKKLEFPHGVLVGTKLGPGLKAEGYVLYNSIKKSKFITDKLFGEDFPESGYLPFTISNDQSAINALIALRNDALNQIAAVLVDSCAHISDFFTSLQNEIVFYSACINLHDTMIRRNLPYCFPKLGTSIEFAASGLYDLSLSIRSGETARSNGFDLDGKQLAIITGANQGGKTTFMRSLGQAAFMARCGLFTAAQSFSMPIVSGIATHFKRGEDESMKSGKLDEELFRMSEIIDHLRSGALVLFNESFSSTNEREGTEIALQITNALLEKGAYIFFVTHFYSFASEYMGRNLSINAKKSMEENNNNCLFLKAGRQADGTRNFEISPGLPEKSAYGKELYDKVFKVYPAVGEMLNGVKNSLH